MQLRVKSSLSAASSCQTFKQIEQTFGTGKVPQVFRLLKSQPVLLAHLWGQFHALVLHGDLPRVLKELVGLVVAAATHCDHIRVFLLHHLSQQSAEPEILAAIVQGNYDATGLSHATRAVLQYAAIAIANRTACGSVAKQQWQTLHHQTMQALEDTGLEESERLELIATIALFEQLCTVANLLHLGSESL
ncbi:carboxymuconolactone decarboxylase family protein [Leptolyngbya sp. FACHB-321]|uniref:carboxymuconolactone decarboxylase family protein n=1 Tax=Leptolyngbya sp. FACHB-321 TaxID=2692807 RepID=UPI0016846C34|nr:carboxymuconolactone decarboxylase family protein [Leptolyngbya sp. FACHB-321]MBD2038123.1 carboxymuconolactone decarboxylase family protein [Leptolyngbya sp. FACHB-321]